MKRKIIVGATSAIAEHMARLWVEEEPIELVLIGRCEDKLNRVAQDLEIRSPKSVIRVQVSDFLNPVLIEKTVSLAVDGRLVDCVLIAHGVLPDQIHCQTDLTYCQQALEINAISPVLFAEAFIRHLEKTNHGLLAIIGSVAGDRGRKSNYIYGAAKGLLARFVQGLQHRLAHTKVSVLLINPGPTETPMTAHLKEKGLKLACVTQVAVEIQAAIRKKKSIVYAPGHWRWVMAVIKLLPAPIFNRLNI